MLRKKIRKLTAARQWFSLSPGGLIAGPSSDVYRRARRATRLSLSPKAKPYKLPKPHVSKIQHAKKQTTPPGPLCLRHSDSTPSSQRNLHPPIPSSRSSPPGFTLTRSEQWHDPGTQVHVISFLYWTLLITSII
jgi:hypothetical protein